MSIVGCFHKSIKQVMAAGGHRSRDGFLEIDNQVATIRICFPETLLLVANSSQRRSVISLSAHLISEDLTPRPLNATRLPKQVQATAIKPIHPNELITDIHLI